MMKLNVSATLFLGAFFTCSVFGQKNEIHFSSNGSYTNLLIAIEKNVEEDEHIITNLTRMFAEASQLLYHASRQHVYWKEIKILVPNTWSRNSQYGLASTESYDRANMLVHKGTDDEPYVDQLLGCGKQAQAIHMTPRFITDPAYREEEFGATEKVLVRTWGYFRWGLFKEHYAGNKNANLVYYNPTSRRLEGTRCPATIEGHIRGDKDERCGIGPGSIYDSDCRFVPDDTGQTATSSLLFGTRGVHIPSIEEFCDDTSDLNNRHNHLANNLMNLHCDGRSAWSVMRTETLDFVHGPQDVFDTTPTFKIVQVPVDRLVVLVLDISGSMAGRRFARMIQSCTDFIQNVIPDHSQLGIVTFGTYSTITSPLTEVTSTSREALVNALPSGTAGSTCIGCGILSGLQVFGNYAMGGYIMLLSDGGENATPYIRDVVEEIDSSGVTMDTIAISNSADQQMLDLSLRTSGIAAFCPDSDSGSCLTQAFQTIITDRPDVGVGMVPVQIFSSDFTIPANPGHVNLSVVIDSGLGNDTVITVTWKTVSALVTVVASGPDGTVIDHTDARYDVDTTIELIQIKIPRAQPGVWQIRISSSVDDEQTSVSVTSKPRGKDYTPVTVNVILGSREVDFSQERALSIFAQVRQGYQPVLGADVHAIVTSSYGYTTLVQLHDSGSGSDLATDDGVYSGYFLAFSANGRYQVKVDVLGYDEITGMIHQSTRGKRSAATAAPPSLTPSLMRTASGGVFEVQSFTPLASDIVPPSKIHDLAYSSFSYDNSTVTLTWTAVGDDLDQGTASRYDLRYATNFTIIQQYVNDSIIITNDQLVAGNLSNVAMAGDPETVVVELPERGQDIIYYCRVRAWDEAGNAGLMSNIVHLSIRYIPPLQDATFAPNISTEIVTDSITTESPTDLIVTNDPTHTDFFVTSEIPGLTSHLTNPSATKTQTNTIVTHGNSVTTGSTTNLPPTTLEKDTIPMVTHGNIITTENTPSLRSTSTKKDIVTIVTHSNDLTTENPTIRFHTNTQKQNVTMVTNIKSETTKNTATPPPPTPMKETTPFSATLPLNTRSTTTTRDTGTGSQAIPKGSGRPDVTTPEDQRPLRSTHETVTESKPAGPEPNYMIVAFVLSVILGMVVVGIVVSLAWYYMVKKKGRSASVVPLRPHKQAWSKNSLPGIEVVIRPSVMSHKNPTFSYA